MSRGLPAALDIIVVLPLQALTVAKAATTQGHTLLAGENRKMAAHVEACCSAEVIFILLVVESLGGWSETALHTIKNIGRQLGQRLGIPPADSTTHIARAPLPNTLYIVCLWKGSQCLHVDKVLSYQLSRGGWDHLNTFHFFPLLYYYCYILCDYTNLYLTLGAHAQRGLQ